LVSVIRSEPYSPTNTYCGFDDRIAARFEVYEVAPSAGVCWFVTV